MGYDNTIKAFNKSLSNLNTDYVDLYLIHWPRPNIDNCDFKKLDIESYRAMEDLYSDGKIKALGFSNFMPHHIENILNNCKVFPSVNQIEFHPGYTQEYTVNYCKKNNISIQAWSPMGRGRVLKNEYLKKIADDLNISVATLCLAYDLNRGITVIPKASDLDRMKENLDAINIKLSDEIIHKISSIPQLGWSGEHPDFNRVYFDK